MLLKNHVELRKFMRACSLDQHFSISYYGILQLKEKMRIMNGPQDERVWRHVDTICKSSKFKMVNYRFRCCVWFGYAGQKSIQYMYKQSNIYSEFTFE